MKSIATDHTKLRKLLEKGVHIPCPESVEIGVDVDPDRISGEDVTIHTGCKIYGPKTLVMPGVVLGYEAPVTVHNCQLGRNVKLKGGFFYESCLLEGAGMGSGAQIREACLIEEGARGAHTVGLKQTILFPFVTLGSLINFCDCLMAGGTDERNHSEVGSSYIHFNYTPNQDKATPSMMGDVPGGVMLNQPPIFLGGHGGIVGPVRITYGTVVAAGTIVRRDQLKENTLLLGCETVARTLPFHQGLYTNIKKLIASNTIYVSNLIALRRWYLNVRSRFIKNGPMERDLFEGAVEKLDKAIGKRLERFAQVAKRMPRSVELYRSLVPTDAGRSTIEKKHEFYERWPEMEQAFKDGLEHEGSSSRSDAFLGFVEKAIARKGKNYLNVIRGFNETESMTGTTWLQGLIDDISGRVFGILPSLGVE